MTARKRFSVRALSVEDAVAPLPSLEAWSGNMEDDVDLLIVSRGFEDRAGAVPAALASAGCVVRGPVLFGRYRTNEIENDRRAEELAPLFGVISSQESCCCDADVPSDIQEKIERLMSSITKIQCHVVIDISAASSTFILSTMLALLHLRRPIKLTVLYASAAEYHEPGAEFRTTPPMQWEGDRQRESGVADVGKNELQNGIHHDHLPNFAIAIPSMFGARLQRCLGYLGLDFQGGEEEEVYWLLPDTDNQDHQWRHDAIMRTIETITNKENGGSGERATASFGRCGAQDYRQCVRLLMWEIERRQGKNISLIHMGTKLQAVGVALALAARPEVALVHARPIAFSADSYSRGIGPLWKIVFSDLEVILNRLCSIGTISIMAH